MPDMPKFTKTPPEIVAAFEAARPDRPGVERKTMFGYPAFFVRGNMFAFTFGPRIAVRLDEGARARAMKTGATTFEVMPGRPMTEYVTVPASAMKGAALERWVNDALAYAGSLPAKSAKPAASTKAPRTAKKPAAKRGARMR